MELLKKIADRLTVHFTDDSTLTFTSDDADDIWYNLAETDIYSSNAIYNEKNLSVPIVHMKDTLGG